MAKDFKLNKSELTKKKREEKTYYTYLPVLKLKEEQLQNEHNRVKKELEVAYAERTLRYQELLPYIKFFPDKYALCIKKLVTIKNLETKEKVIAGVKIKIFYKMEFEKFDIPVWETPVWLKPSLEILKNYLVALARSSFLASEEKIIKKELRKATQKVNLFETVLIPKAKMAIKQIKIALQDEQIASITRGKIAKKKNVEVFL